MAHVLENGTSWVSSQGLSRQPSLCSPPAQLLSCRPPAPSPAGFLLPMGCGRNFWTPSREEAWVCPRSPFHATDCHLCFAVAFGVRLPCQLDLSVISSGWGGTEPAHGLAPSFLRRASRLAPRLAHTPVFRPRPPALPLRGEASTYRVPFVPRAACLQPSPRDGAFTLLREKPQSPSFIFKGGVTGKQGSGDFPSTR